LIDHPVRLQVNASHLADLLQGQRRSPR
jgi:hypothetical protein